MSKKNETPKPAESYGGKEPRDWRKHAKPVTARDEADDSETGTQSDHDFAVATVGFDPFAPE